MNKLVLEAVIHQLRGELAYEKRVGHRREANKLQKELAKVQRQLREARA